MCLSPIHVSCQELQCACHFLVIQPDKSTVNNVIDSVGYTDGQISSNYIVRKDRRVAALKQNSKCVLLVIPYECELFLILF